MPSRSYSRTISSLGSAIALPCESRTQYTWLGQHVRLMARTRSATSRKPSVNAVICSPSFPLHNGPSHNEPSTPKRPCEKATNAPATGTSCESTNPTYCVCMPSDCAKAAISEVCWNPPYSLAAERASNSPALSSRTFHSDDSRSCSSLAFISRATIRTAFRYSSRLKVPFPKGDNLV